MKFNNSWTSRQRAILSEFNLNIKSDRAQQFFQNTLTDTLKQTHLMS